LNNQADPSKLSTKERLGFLAKDSLLYGGAAALSRAFSLITFPLLARSFSVAEYGLIDLFVVWAGLLNIFFVFGQDSAVARFYYEYQDDGERKQIISQSLVFQICFIVALLPFLWHFSGPIAAKLTDNADGELFLKIILLQTPFTVLINFSQNLLKWTFAKYKFLALSLGQVCLNLILLSLVLFFLERKIQYILSVYLIVNTVFGIFGLYWIRHFLTFPSGVAKLRQLLPFAIPFGVVCCLAAFVPAIERSLVTQLVGKEELGLYAAGLKVASLIALFIQAFQMAWAPFALSIYKEKDAPQTYSWVLRLFSMSMCILTFCLAAVARPAILFFASERYVQSSLVVFPLTMGFAIESIGWITEIGIGISKKSYLGLYSYVLFVAATLAGIWLFVPSLGFFGVALGSLLGKAVKAAFQSYLAQKAYPIDWPYKPVIFLILLSCLLGCSNCLILRGNSLATSFAFILSSLGVAIAFWLTGFSLIEREKLMRSSFRMIKNAWDVVGRKVWTRNN